MYTYNDWVIIYCKFFFVAYVINLIILIIKDCKEKGVFIILTYPIFLGILWGVIFIALSLSLVTFGNREQNQNKYTVGTNKVWMVDYKDKKSYDKFKEVEQGVNNEYYKEFENLDSTKYYYDYMNIELVYKKISFSQCFEYLTNLHENIILNAKVEFHKNTVYKTLQGILKTNIDNSNVYYTIDKYTLGKDEKGQIASLANNQQIKLDIVYNKESCKDDKNITEYKIINAETKDN